MPITEDKQKKIEVLKGNLRDKKTALRKFRFEMTGGKVKNVKTGNILRKEIARILTEINKITYE